MKFEFYTEVISKRLGPPMTGIIVGVIDAKHFKDHYISSDIPTWTEIYPDWEDKLVYFIRFNQPQKTIDFQSWKQQLKERSPWVLEQNLDEMTYEACNPDRFGAAYPEDDLEEFDTILETYS